ncbi:SCP2 sterol-binding domain-containing protein [Gemmata sp. JC673]|uniref:SCP2 sterol-binding domain-containing protein n=1 Tax=Gemmata algarum TaxID=2975278 RepID=A0ABU5F1A5_9BACT|nr:SCP2 sterol-binding domain-containing protein [Gemmata algarum]MDY3561366.1 SCP2 sterol-binding domain-containing protein [Gemmata algarum]
MAPLEDHPTVRAVRARTALPTTEPPRPIDATWLKALALECGADDAGLVAIDRPELDDQRADIRAAYPPVRALLSFVCRMNRDAVKAPARSVSNLEFHHTIDHTDEVARAIVRRLDAAGVPALNPPSGFPMEMQQFPGKIWVVSHKPVAVAAGLGRMGIHRNVIHPRFGNFVLLGTVLIGADASAQGAPIDYNPCLSCKLCVAACPVGAIGADGHFDPSACLTHNYREFMGGFIDWVETVVESDSKTAYRKRVADAETASLWQSLAFGPNYKAAYCLAVCPAGEDVIAPFLQNRAGFVAEVVKPLQQKEEPLYVVPGSDAEQYAARKFPHKPQRKVSGIRPTSIAGFLRGMPIVFQREQSAGLNAVYHFTFTGHEPAEATVTIRDKTLAVQTGLHGTPACAITADSDRWLGFLRKERSIVWALVRRKVRVKGPLRLLTAFGKCFPS